MNDAILRFRQVMAQYFDQPLTPEIAAAIELAAFTEPECAINIDLFAPTVWGDCLIQLESFREVLPELIPLHELHWRETEKYRHGLALNPNYGAMVARERAGHLLQFMVRRDGAAIGHLRVFLGDSLHTQTAIAEEDTLFIHPDHRGGFLVMALLRYAESVLLQLDYLETRTNTKVLTDARGKRIDVGVLMRRLGYAHVADQYVKFLKKEPHHVQ